MSIIDLGDARVSAATGGRSVTDGADLCADARPVVLLVHGAGMDRSFWALQTRWLNHHGLAALALDLPGHGNSPDPEAATIAEYGDWLSRVSTTVCEHGGPVHLVGHSMGSFIVLETAAALADRIGSITLVGTAAEMGVHPVLLKTALADPPRAAEFMAGWGYAGATRNAPHPSPGTSMVGSTVAMVARTAPGVLHRDLAMCAAYKTAVAKAQAFAGPATVLGGADDRMTPPRNAQPIVDALSEPMVEFVTDVGHMIPVEAPALTRHTIAVTAKRASSGAPTA